MGAFVSVYGGRAACVFDSVVFSIRARKVALGQEENKCSRGFYTLLEPTNVTQLLDLTKKAGVCTTYFAEQSPPAGESKCALLVCHSRQARDAWQDTIIEAAEPTRGSDLGRSPRRG